MRCFLIFSNIVYYTMIFISNLEQTLKPSYIVNRGLGMLHLIHLVFGCKTCGKKIIKGSDQNVKTKGFLIKKEKEIEETWFPFLSFSAISLINFSISWIIININEIRCISIKKKKPRFGFIYSIQVNKRQDFQDSIKSKAE